MARAFNVNALRNSFELPALTRQEIQALMLDLDCHAIDVVILAIAQLWQREVGAADRNLAGEVDALAERLAHLEAAKAAKE